MEFWEAIVECVNAIINGISTYVHSPEAIIIDTRLADLVKYCSDQSVYIIRDFLDVFGR